MGAPLAFSGQESFAVPRGPLWRFLTDVRNVPLYSANLRDARYPAPATLSARLKPSFSFVRGELEITVQFLEPLAEPTAKLSIAAPGVGTKIFIDASMELAEEAGGAATLLKWEANSRFEGLLSAVSRGLIEGAARKIIADVFQAIRAHFATKVSPEGVA